MTILQAGMVSFADVMTALQAQATKTDPKFRGLLTESVKIGS